VNEIRNAHAVDQTQIELFLFRSQVFFDGLPSSGEPTTVTAIAGESRRMISVLQPAILEGTQILSQILLPGLSSFEPLCEKIGHSEVFQVVSPLLRHVRFSNPQKSQGAGFCFQGWGA
jgi:hypothetical protein